MTGWPACAGCGQPVRWGFTTLGARIPVDPVADAERGTVWLTDGGRFRVLTREELERGRGHALAPQRLFVAHWGSCPAANRFRMNPGQLSMLGGGDAA